MMKRLVFLMMAVPLFAVGQDDFLVLVKGDTLRGDIQIVEYDKLDRVTVKTKDGRQTLTAVQVGQMKLKGVIYKPVQMDNTIRFMQLITPGYLSLYAFRLQNQAIYDGQYLVKLGGSSMEVPNLAFKYTMATFLEDCPTVSNKLKKGVWGKRDLDSIIYAYNLCVTKKPTEPLSPLLDASDPRLQKIQALKDRLEASTITSRQDILELLADLSKKVENNQRVPNYFLEGLKSYLSNEPGYAGDLEELIKLVKN